MESINIQFNCKKYMIRKNKKIMKIVNHDLDNKQARILLFFYSGLYHYGNVS